MTAWSYSLVWLSCLFVGEIVNQINGDVSPPWMTYRGCYGRRAGSRNTTLSDNGVTNCFRECANFTHIGIQDSTCICFEDMPSTTRMNHYFCRVDDLFDQRMRLYSKVTKLPYMINQEDYGYVYMTIQPFEFHASNSLSERHGECIEETNLRCKCRIDAVAGSEANPAHPLVSYLDFNTSCQMPLAGDFWIGMFRESPVLSSSSVRPSSTISSSSQPTFPSSGKTPTSFIETVTTISSTNKPALLPITQTSNAFPKSDVTPSSQSRQTTGYPKAIPGEAWEVVAIVFIVIAVLLSILIIAGIVEFLRRKKKNQIIDHKDDPASVDVSAKTLETDKRSQNGLQQHIVLTNELKGNHSLEREEKHRKTSHDGQSDQKEQNPESPEKTRKHRRSHHREQTDVTNLSGTPVEYDPKISEKKRRRRRSHHREESDVTNLSDTAVEHNADMYEKKTKHRKSHRAEETLIPNLSDTAMERNLLENAEHNKKKRKKRRKSKKERTDNIIIDK